MTLQRTIFAAQAADDAFEAAIQTAGFESRWDWPKVAAPIGCPILAAYNVKVAADQALHEAFEQSRQRA